MVRWRIIATVAALSAALSQGAWSMSVSDAKGLPDGQAVSLTQKVVTYSATGYFYVEEDVRNIGVRVEKSDHALAVGMRVDIEGTIQTNTGGNEERYIAASSAVQSAPPNDYGSVPPVGMGNASLGGGDWLYTPPSTAGQKGATGASGLNNIGLLVKAWGSYEQLDDSTFTIDDGAGLNITCSVPSGFFLYSGWQYVVVTGISTIYKFDSDTYPPNILVSSIDVILPPESVSAPGTPGGEQNPILGVTYPYSAVPSSACSQGHPVEYSYDWGDGTNSPWSTSTSASHAWSTMGPKTITVTARCQTHSDVSAVSPGLSVNVGEGPCEMIYIPAGDFLMGNSNVGNDAVYRYANELPQHSVSLSDYWIGKYEVTRGQYQQFMDAGGYTNQAYWSTDGWIWKVAKNRTQPDSWAAQQNWGTPPGTFPQGDDHPVVGVNYYEAEAFCKWASGHLPTEAQREKAARWAAATSHPNVYPWDDVWDQGKCNNWADTLYPGYQTAPVGSYDPLFGDGPDWHPATEPPDPDCRDHACRDMAGNVWEWCKDWYGSSYYSQTPPGGWLDPEGASSGSSRVLRGGSWYNLADYNRCAYRYFKPPSFYDTSCGFRLAR